MGLRGLCESLTQAVIPDSLLSFWPFAVILSPSLVILSGAKNLALNLSTRARFLVAHGSSG